MVEEWQPGATTVSNEIAPFWQQIHFRVCQLQIKVSCLTKRITVPPCITVHNENFFHEQQCNKYCKHQGSYEAIQLMQEAQTLCDSGALRLR